MGPRLRRDDVVDGEGPRNNAAAIITGLVPMIHVFLLRETLLAGLVRVLRHALEAILHVLHLTA